MKRLILLAVMAAFPLVSISTSEAEPEPRHPLANCASSIDENGHESGVECWPLIVVPNLAAD